MREALRQNGLRAAAAAMALMLLVSFGIPMPVMNDGQVDVEREQVVGEADGALASIAIVSVGLMAAGAHAKGMYDHYVEERDPSAMTDAELKVAIAQDAYSMQQTQENYITDSQNSLELTRNDAIREARMTYINERAAGASHSQAVTAAKARVDDMYTRHELQLIRKYETQVVQGGGICQMESQWKELGDDSNVRITESKNDIMDYQGLPANTMTCNYSDTSGLSKFHGISSASIENQSGHVALNYTLINGSSVEYRTIAVQESYNNDWVVVPVMTAGDTPSEYGDMWFEVYDTEAGSYTKAIALHDYSQMADNIRQQRSGVQDELGNASSGYLMDINTKVQNSNYTWTDIAIDRDPVDVNNTSVSKTEYYQRVLSVNMDGPEPGTVVTIDTGTGNNSSISGHLYTTWNPSATNGTWKAGHTYNASQGLTYLIGEEDGELRKLEGDMTITEITTPSGESVESTEHDDVRVETSNTSDLKQEMQRLQERIEELEDQLEDDDGGFSLPDFGLGGDSAVGVVLVAGAALILLGGGGGGATTVLAGRRN